MEQQKDGVIENLDRRIRTLMSESKDPHYTDYLQKMLGRVIQQKYQVDLLEAELDRSYQLYLRRMEELKNHEVQQPVQPLVQQPVQRPIQQPATSVPAKEKPQKSNAEFAVGAAVLSVVGGGFILAALVTLGLTFMEGLFKGLCLYGASVTFILVAELVLYRRWSMLGATLSAIGIGGLYLSTVLNYLALHNFNMWVTLGITLGITLFVVWLSRKRNSVLYRIIGIIAGYLCFFTIGNGITDTEFIVVSGMLLLLNVLCILWPVKKAGTAIAVTHMAVNTVLSIFFLVKADEFCGVGRVPIIIFILCSMTIVMVLYVSQYFVYKNETECLKHIGIPLAFYICMGWYAILFCSFISKLVLINVDNRYCYITALIVEGIGLLSLGILWIGKCSGKRHIYSFLNVMLFFIMITSERTMDFTVSILVMLVIVKLLSLSLKKNLSIRINDLILTLWVATYALGNEAYRWIMLIGIIFSILMISYWQTTYEIILSLAVVLCIVHLPVTLFLPAVVGIFLISILVFNNVKRWRGKYIFVFNIYALLGQSVCFLCLSSPIYHNAYITYLCMLIFGVATIILTMQEKYQMDFHGKHMVLVVFLTYMAFIFRVGIPVVNSILLMVIALVSVTIGFMVNKKSVRIYGLVLSLFVCCKLVLYDFFKAPSVQKTILFLTVGIIALVIASIYIVLEKKSDASSNERRE